MERNLPYRSLVSLMAIGALVAACSSHTDTPNTRGDEANGANGNNNNGNGAAATNRWTADLKSLNAMTLEDGEGEAGMSIRAATGTATFTLRDGTLTAEVSARGLAPSMLHLQHIHSANRCPPPEADTNGDGFIDVVEGLPFYGGIMVGLDADLANLGAETSFPTASAAGLFDYRQTVALDALEGALGNAVDLAQRTVVVHGVAEDFPLPASVQSLPGVPAFMTLPVACGEIEAAPAPSPEPEPPVGQATRFRIEITNTSGPGTVPTDRADGVVALAPGAYAVYRGISNPLFTVGSQADVGTERLAEDGDPETKVSAANDVSGVLDAATFGAPGGADGPAIVPGETGTFTITASPGDRLQLMTMFVQSNDWFYALGGDGLALFDGNTPVSGDMTSRVVLYDAGTEADTAPGTGEFQAPVQSGPNTGPTDPNANVRLASESGFTIPATTSVVRIVITPLP